MKQSRNNISYLVITPLFPNNKEFSSGEYIYDQVDTT